MPKPGRKLLSRAWLRTEEKVPRIFLTFFPVVSQEHSSIGALLVLVNV